jgi:hypothetical protein
MSHFGSRLIASYEQNAALLLQNGHLDGINTRIEILALVQFP